MDKQNKLRHDMEMERRKQIIRFNKANLETGEYQEGFYSRDNLKNVRIKDFTKVFIMKERFEKPVYDGYLLRLIDHIAFETNKLIKKTNTGSTALKKKDIQEILGSKDKPISRMTVWKFLSAAEDKNIIIEHNKEYYLNPEIANKGKTVKEVLALFGIKK